MTVQNTAIKNVYVGNGSTTEYPITFEVNEAHPEYIHVYIEDADGATTETTNFTADMAARKVTYPAEGEPLAAGLKLVVARELPLLQQLELQNQGDFFAQDIEQAFDDLTMITQQLADASKRSIKTSLTSDENIDLSLPAPAPGMGLGWNESGTNIINMDSPQAVYEETKALRDEVANMKASVDSSQEYVEGTLGDLTDIAAEVEANRQQVASDAYEANLAAEKAEALAAQVTVYDPAVTYEPGDTVMTAEGDTYRCIARSTGENPNDSNKWVLVSQVEYETFELDVNGDLQPLYVPKTSTNFQIDENGDIMPID